MGPLPTGPGTGPTGPGAAGPSKGSSLARAFREADAEDVSSLSSCLRVLEGMSCTADYKAELARRLSAASGDRVADVGCGLGFDVVRTGRRVGTRGLTLGVDSSTELLARARALAPADMPQVRYAVGDAHRLPLATGVLDAARVDRALQHVRDPAQVVRELARAVRAGGRVACAEPDWETFTVTDDDRDTTRAVAHAWCAGFRHGWIGRELPALLGAAGVRDVRLTGHLLTARGYAEIDAVFDLTGTVRGLLSGAGDDRERLEQWRQRVLHRDRAGTLMATVTVFCASGRVRGP
ncbi:methyltransferase domain-containing protein [Streptomyces sp. NBC_01264]|uniref:methyltransferase domain-containing protein n=1 Tax=Streptomyces sp. NBC_01264 TaxID=2903804 RepID=UPI0022525171|nr:methyltransferase domain-containing protein [Streptomyces sp. NBC_01264]MCX4781808.1 methyltransferase domain-containing protein [Streptomyces sp. NBC_01264]